MCCCQFYKVACIIQLLAQAEAYAPYQRIERILFYLHILLHANAVQIITVCIVVLAVDASQGQLYARIKVEAVVIFKTLAIFCADAGAPGLVIAAQLVTAVIEYLVVIIQLAVLGNDVNILSVFTLPGTVDACTVSRKIAAAVAIGCVTIVVGYCCTDCPAVACICIIA